MSVLLALLLVQAVEPSPAPPASATADEESEITVIARKAAWWRGTWLNKDGVTTCTTQTSTGDGEIDRVLCDGLVACAPRYVPQMESVVRARQAAGHTVSRDDLPALLRPVNARIMRCARSHSRAPFLALVRARRAARK